MAAIHALERVQPGGEWRQQLKSSATCRPDASSWATTRARTDEKPAHEVHLDAFYIGKYPVTNAEYARYMADIGRAFTVPAGKADHPVVEVSWYDARDYAAWAGMRLLTEAEWEKAASWDEAGRSGLLGRQRGHKRAYPWGDQFDPKKCNSEESGIGGTTPVGKYSPQGDSPYGVADMAGNVWEWCADWYDSDYYRKSPAENPTGPADGDWRVLRGGSYYERQGACGLLRSQPQPPAQPGRSTAVFGWVRPPLPLISEVLWPSVPLDGCALIDEWRCGAAPLGSPEGGVCAPLWRGFFCRLLVTTGTVVMQPGRSASGASQVGGAGLSADFGSGWSGLRGSPTAIGCAGGGFEADLPDGVWCAL